MVSDKNVANAVGGKTARACDSCVRKRARWYCAADDAFLCQACDFSVHSANPLARRHERVKLKTASLKSDESPVENSSPAWHRGFKRKPRTPRQGKSAAVISNPNPFPVVPEVGDEISHDENDEQLLCRVPIYDPFVGEICTTDVNRIESKVLLAGFGQDDDNLHGFLSPEMDLDFAADVESLLGRGLENESYGMEGLGLTDCKEDSTGDTFFSGRVKIEEKEGIETAPCHFDTDIDMERETFELNFDYDTPASCGEEDEKASVVATDGKTTGEHELDGGKKRVKLLKLDYDSVIISWASQGCPWTTGCRPDINADEYWPDCMGICGTEVSYPYGEMGGNLTRGDGGREARVSRYREKRRTRLFSKKIRYEVRKLNAEKRPRMKGRFVKRTSVGGPGYALVK